MGFQGPKASPHQTLGMDQVLGREGGGPCPCLFRPPLGLGSNVTSSVRPSLTTLVNSTLLPIPALFSSSLIIYHVRPFLRILFELSSQWNLHQSRAVMLYALVALEQRLGNKHRLKQ